MLTSAVSRRAACVLLQSVSVLSGVLACVLAQIHKSSVKDAPL